MTEPAFPRAFGLSAPMQAALPLVAFLVVNRIGGLRWAVAAATVLSLKVAADRRRSRLPIGVFMPLITAAAVLRGVIGIATNSETVYFGLGIASKYVAVAILVISLIVRRPLAERAGPYVLKLSAEQRQHPSYMATMRWITGIAAAYWTLSASFDVWLFRQSSIESFVIVRFLVSWPLSAIALITTIAIARRHLLRIPGVASLGDAINESFLDGLDRQTSSKASESSKSV